MFESFYKKHVEWTPCMAVTDVVKLAYQSAFGCGHLLSARDTCADFVRQEIETVNTRPGDPVQTPLYGGLCRLNLACPQVRDLTPERIADLMFLSDRHVRMRPDNLARFEQMLIEATEMARRGEMPFSGSEMENYLHRYPMELCPPVSHSDMFRERYDPAYRVVLTDLALLVPVIAEMDRRLEKQGRVAVALDGMCGSGKTCLADLLCELYGAKTICMDDFFLPPELRTPERLATPGGNVHYERFLSEVLNPLKEKRDFFYGSYDCQTGKVGLQGHEDSAVTVIEGSYSHHPAFDEAHRQINVLRVFVSVDEEEQLRRLTRRNPDRMEAFRTRWIPLEKSYFEAYDRKRQADIRLESCPY